MSDPGAGPDQQPLPPSGYPAPSGYPPPSVPSAWDAPSPGPGAGSSAPPPPPSYAPGYREGGPVYVPAGQGLRTPGLATAALVCGLAGMLALNFILGPLALVFGIVSLRQINAAPQSLKGRGFAIAGIVLCFVDLALFLVLFTYADQIQDWIDRNRR